MIGVRVEHVETVGNGTTHAAGEGCRPGKEDP